jgi:hypothetical protein
MKAAEAKESPAARELKSGARFPALTLRRSHQALGVLTVIVFLLTGQYMDFYTPGMPELDRGVRMMFRSTHVYILLSGLLNIAVGTYLSHSKTRWRKRLQLAGSYLILAGPFLLTVAFFYEPVHTDLRRPITEPAMIGLLVGTLCHMVGARSVE